jgi:hypothetical protein
LDGDAGVPYVRMSASNGRDGEQTNLPRDS